MKKHRASGRVQRNTKAEEHVSIHEPPVWTAVKIASLGRSSQQPSAECSGPTGDGSCWPLHFRTGLSREVSRKPIPGRCVAGMHVITRDSLNTRHNPDGTFWSGAWQVDHKHAAAAVKKGSYLALHQTKSECSFLQGKVIGWDVQTPDGDENIVAPCVRFLVQPSGEGLNWVGSGTGEKGYLWERTNAAT